MGVLVDTDINVPERETYRIKPACLTGTLVVGGARPDVPVRLTGRG